MTRERFALWSFERDLKAGCYLEEVPRITAWHQLPIDEQEIYLEEADMYLKKSMAEWPEDILERMRLQ